MARVPKIMVVDFLAALVLLLFALMKLAVFTHQPSRIDTYGQYAVTVTWPAGRHDDVDTYVRDPSGAVAWYASPDAGEMHLEHDDLAAQGSGYQGQPNFERVVLRGYTPGEYVANVHLFRSRDGHPIPVTVELWRLRGNDQQLTSRTVTLTREGDERTAFRFTLTRSGAVTGLNRLPVSLLQDTRVGP